MGALVCYQYCTDHQTSDKRLFATFARTRPPDTHISKSVVAVLRAFNWTTVSQSSPIHPSKLPPSVRSFERSSQRFNYHSESESALAISLLLLLWVITLMFRPPAREWRVISSRRAELHSARLLFFALRPGTFLGLTAHFLCAEFREQ